MQVMVIGASGMAGHMIVKYLRQQGYAVRAVDRNVLDLEDTLAVTNYFKYLSQLPDVIINCAGILVKASIDNPGLAYRINTKFPHFLEETFALTRTQVIHISTDCVFDGLRGNYVETDEKTETNSYGASKARGEIVNDKDVTFRMSIIGPELKTHATGLLTWMLTTEQTTLQGWTNAWWNGITTLQLAKCLDLHLRTRIITGIYHLVNNNFCITKYDLLNKINDIYSLNKIIEPQENPKKINKILVDTRQLVDFCIPDYDTQLIELRDFK